MKNAEAEIRSGPPPKSGVFLTPFFIKRFADITIRDIPTVGGKTARDIDALRRRGSAIREAILATALPTDLETEILGAYDELRASSKTYDVAVRSSATAEDLPDASFAAALEKKKFSGDDLSAGRAFVKAYVEYIHCAEALYQQATKTAHGHFEGTSAAPVHDKH